MIQHNQKKSSQNINFRLQIREYKEVDLNKIIVYTLPKSADFMSLKIFHLKYREF